MSRPAAISPALPIRLGLERGWVTFRAVMTTREGVINNVVWNGVPLVVLILNRNATLPGTDISLGASLLPGMLALLVTFAVMGTAYYLSTDREDGTLLRAKAVPHGMTGYVVGLSTLAALDTVLQLVVVLIPGMFIVPGVAVGDPGLWFGMVGYVVLGLLACLPLGILVGSLARNPRTVGGVGMLATIGLALASGLFFPLQAMWGVIQVAVQAFPLYWLGLGMRSAFLPDEAAAFEIGGSWRTFETIGMLGIWAAIGLALGPVLLRRMARRESGTAVEARRQQALQRT